MIQNPIHTTAAYLVWQSPPNGEGSRAHLPVAELRVENGSVTFRYLRGEQSFETAVLKGFQHYTGIPLDRQDTSDAVQTLARRLPNPSREDYPEYLARFGLSVQHDLPPLSLLAYTGARLTSDAFSVVDTFEGFEPPFEYIFEVAGRRHYSTDTPQPKIGDLVRFEAEPDNPHDADAVRLLDAGGDTYGYINRCQSAQVSTWTEQGMISGEVFRVNGTPSNPRLFVKAKINV